VTMTLKMISYIKKFKPNFAAKGLPV